MLQAMRPLFKGHSFINAATCVGTMHQMRRWWLLYLNIFFLLCSLVPPSSLVFLSRSIIGLLGNSQGVLALQDPRKVSFFIFPSQAQARRSSQDLMCICHFFPPRAEPTIPTSYSVPSLLHLGSQLQFYGIEDPFSLSHSKQIFLTLNGAFTLYSLC